jgi:nucleotide-binding universal stress UspA family protein
MLVFAIVAAWVLFGAVAVLVMRRRGHDSFSWALTFLFFGPFALPAAVSADRHPPPEAPAPSHDGGLDVLVAHHGSPEATAALHAALSLLGPHMTSLTLATVVDIEVETIFSGRETLQEAHERLDALARDVAGATAAPVDTVVLHGDPRHALENFAAEHGYELIVTGSEASSASHLIRGSVARKFSKGAKVPVLIGPTTR